MADTYIVTGTLTDERTVSLDEAVPLKPMKVRVVVEPLRPALHRSYQEIMAEIRENQKSRRYQPPSREEVDAYLRDRRNC